MVLSRLSSVEQHTSRAENMSRIEWSLRYLPALSITSLGLVCQALSRDCLLTVPKRLRPYQLRSFEWRASLMAEPT